MLFFSSDFDQNTFDGYNCRLEINITLSAIVHLSLHHLFLYTIILLPVLDHYCIM